MACLELVHHCSLGAAASWFYGTVNRAEDVKLRQIIPHCCASQTINALQIPLGRVSVRPLLAIYRQNYPTACQRQSKEPRLSEQRTN
ncbi:MAG: hypothetical protein CM15mP74_07770 [Halieaceae bacterium]|nr:MAG: hypothetical protein CM15mP74_07770 [Halieaceae bacterium]